MRTVTAVLPNNSCSSTTSGEIYNYILSIGNVVLHILFSIFWFILACQYILYVPSSNLTCPIMMKPPTTTAECLKVCVTKAALSLSILIVPCLSILAVLSFSIFIVLVRQFACKYVCRILSKPFLLKLAFQ